MKNEDLKSRYLVILIGSLALVFGVLVFAGNFVRENVVIPLEYDLWLVKVAIRAIPQYIFWGVIVALGLIMALYSLEANIKRPPKPDEQKSEVAQTRGQRVLFWVIQIRSMRRGFFSRVRFAEFYGKLITDILTYTGQIDMKKLDLEVEKGTLDLPAGILTFLKLKYIRFYDLPRLNFFLKVKNSLFRLFRIQSKENELVVDLNASLENDLTQSIIYLEKKLEVRSNHYGSN